MQRRGILPDVVAYCLTFDARERKNHRLQERQQRQRVLHLFQEMQPKALKISVVTYKALNTRHYRVLRLTREMQPQSFRHS